MVRVQAHIDLRDGVVESAESEPMLSYAQNAEDVVLERAFAEVTGGFYVDVGACGPIDDSVTFHFYERGWRGVNVEPDPGDYEQLVALRTRDVNLHAAVGGGEGPLVFYPSAVRGLGTLDAARATGSSEIAPIEVEQVSLDHIFAEHAPEEGVDFLKVDVEGWEADVLASANWQQHRPRVVLVEAVDPAGRAAHQEWEPTLLGAGYRLVLFDGLNRFYCRDEDADALGPRLSSPANVLDNWRSVREVALQIGLEERLVVVEAAGASERRRLEQEKEQARRAYEKAQQSLEEAQQSLEEAQQSLEEAQQSLEERRLELASVYASTSWRVTSSIRDASRLARLVRRGNGA
jgi:FkbM family methyltransferase